MDAAPRNTILLGDALQTLRALPHQCVQTVVTSPPYWGLRDYGVPGQYGLEQSIDEYLHTMTAVFEEVRRVLRPDGTLWLNMGDGHASNVGGHSDGSKTKGGVAGHVPNAWGGGTQSPVKRPAGLKPKDLVGMPWRVAFALQADGWYLRSDIIWHKPNPMPESVQDRPTRAHEYLFLMAKNQRYYYDPIGIIEPVTGGAHKRTAGRNSRLYVDRDPAHLRPGVTPKSARPGSGIKANQSYHAAIVDLVPMRNKRTVWTIATAPFPEAHFATFPEALIEPCIMAGSRPGDLVLDPFMGAGTVGVVCRRLGRDYLGIELNPVYVAMAEKRIEAVQQPMLLYAPRRSAREEAG